MSGGEIAALIAAVAFVVLVIFLVQVLLKASKTLDKTNQTIDETKTTVTVLTKDVDVLMHQVEGLLVKSNTLLTDINGKVETVNPVFVAAADLGATVSELNSASHQLVSKVGSFTKTTGKAGVVAKVGKTAFKLIRPNKKQDVKEEVK